MEKAQIVAIVGIMLVLMTAVGMPAVIGIVSFAIITVVVAFVPRAKLGSMDAPSKPKSLFPFDIEKIEAGDQSHSSQAVDWLDQDPLHPHAVYVRLAIDRGRAHRS